MSDARGTAGRAVDILGPDAARHAAAAVLEHVPAPILILDQRARIIFANGHVVRLLGRAMVQLLGEPLSSLLPVGDALGNLSAFLEAPRGQSLTKRIEIPVRADGILRSLEISLSPFALDDVWTALCVIHDSTEDSQVALAEARLNEAQRIAKIGSWTWDVLKDEHWWSDELFRMLQIDRASESRPFERFLELVHPDDRPRLTDNASALVARGPETIDVRVTLPDGAERIFQTRGEITFDALGNLTRMHGTLQDITDRKTVQTALQLTEMRYREAQRIAKIGNWEWNLVTNESWWSEELYRVLEEDPCEYAATFDNFIAKVHPDDRQILVEGQRQVAVGPEPRQPTESRLVLADGRQKVIEQLVEMRIDEYGKPTAVVGTIHDITERRALEHRLRESEARYASTVELAAVGIAHVAAGGRIAWCNRQFREMLGYSAEDLSELTIWQISHPDDVHVTDQERAKLHAGEITSLTVEKRYLRKDGSTIWVRITAALRRSAEGAPLYDVSIVEDITARKIAEERVKFLATHDELTRLPNRTLFAHLLDRAIATAERTNRLCALLFIDLDRFKIVNDSLGHEAGDWLLKEMSSRLARCIKAEDVIARLGGDEFVVLLENLNDLAAAADVAKRILSSALAPIEIKGHECRITVSIGIAAYPQDARDAPTLMKHADMAMYRAKEEGKNNHQVYSSDTSPMSVEHLVLEAQLARALERKEFSLQYQPKVDIATGKIKGAEALLRWWNAELGTVSPAHFIPLAEDSGLIVPIGKWVLRAACEQNVAWQRRGLRGIVMSVNLSPRQFKDSALLDDIAEVLQQTGMAPELLELEITESMIMHNVDHAAEKAAAIKNLGVRLAIDDFGTGYSSLSQLKRFPIDTLKVDRSFIRDIPDNTEDRAITEAIISLGRALGVTVVAEGVETLEQRSFLRDNRCDEMQGFLFSKPCHPDAFAELLESAADRSAPNSSI